MESVDLKARVFVKNPNLPQLYTIQTMNGLKAALMVSELHGLKQLDGDSFDFETHTVDIRHAESRSKDFMRISPAGKIPALVDFHGPNNQVFFTNYFTLTILFCLHPNLTRRWISLKVGRFFFIWLRNINV